MELSNERLRAALNRSEMTVADLANAIQVDPKTISRWLAGRLPHRRLRWRVSEVLGQEEGYLWPEAAPASGGVTNEIVASYPRRADVDSERWRLLINGAETEIDLLGYTLYFLPQQIPELVDVLVSKCQLGCNIRLVLADPDCEQVRRRDEEEANPITLVARIRSSLQDYAPLLDCAGAELRFQSAPLYNSVYRFDGEMFMTPHLFATPGHAAPLLHLRRLGPEGLFSRFTSHFEGIWASSTPIRQDESDAQAS